MPSQRRIAVVTDDAAALPPEWASPDGAAAAAAPAGGGSAQDGDLSGREGLAVATMPVSIDGRGLTGLASGWLDEVEAALMQGRAVSTSRPSPGHVLSLYRGLEAQGYDGIVSVHCSAELSGSATSARIASAAMRIPVEIVDTRAIAMAEGYAVMAAWEAAGRGAELAEAAEAARTASAGSQLLLWVPGLETLRRGGRIGPSTAAIGSMLQVKPILRVANGQLAVAELPMTDLRARARLMRRVGRLLTDSARRSPELIVHHLQSGAGRERADDLREEIVAQHCPDAVSTSVRMPAVLAAHAGLDSLAVVVRG